MFKFLTCAILFLGSIGLYGCSATRTNLVESGHVNVNVHKTEPITVKRISVLQSIDQDNRHVLVSGKVAREHNRALPLRGHVDLRITSPDGSLIAERAVGFNVRRLTRHVFEGSFITRFDVEIPENATVEAVHHEGDHKNI